MVKMQHPVTLPAVLEFVEYLPNEGVLRWLCNTRNTHAGETVVGACRPDGYRQVGLFGNRFLAHRLMWFIAKGYWADQVDHINGDRSDNRLCNLRDVSAKENRQNICATNRHNLTTGLVGASWDRSRNNFRAYIVIDKKQVNLGRFKTAEEAHATYLLAKGKLHTHNDRMLKGQNV